MNQLILAEALGRINLWPHGLVPALSASNQVRLHDLGSYIGASPSYLKHRFPTCWSTYLLPPPPSLGVAPPYSRLSVWLRHFWQAQCNKVFQQHPPKLPRSGYFTQIFITFRGVFVAFWRCFVTIMSHWESLSTRHCPWVVSCLVLRDLRKLSHKSPFEAVIAPDGPFFGI